MPKVTDKRGVYQQDIGGTMVDGKYYEPHEWAQASLALQIVIVKLLQDMNNQLEVLCGPSRSR
jgi:hypothetical protein